eukprot:COSAG04_NODE_68_length_29323_cov_9.683514_14_plen_182_part_00
MRHPEPGGQRPGGRQVGHRSRTRPARQHTRWEDNRALPHARDTAETDREALREESKKKEEEEENGKLKVFILAHDKCFVCTLRRCILGRCRPPTAKSPASAAAAHSTPTFDFAACSWIAICSWVSRCLAKAELDRLFRSDCRACLSKEAGGRSVSPWPWPGCSSAAGCPSRPLGSTRRARC